MRLHLPSRLFRVVIALMVAVPSAVYAAYTAPTEIVIPEQYSVVKQTESLLDIYSYADSSHAVAFRLTSDFDIEYFSSRTDVEVFQNIPVMTGENIKIGEVIECGDDYYLADVNGSTSSNLTSPHNLLFASL